MTMLRVSPRRGRLCYAMLCIAILDAVAVCSGAESSPSMLSAFVQHRFFVSSQQTRLARTSSSRCPQSISSRPAMVTLVQTGTEEEQLEPLPNDDTFSVRGSWREITYPGTRPSTTASKNFKDVAGDTGGAFQTRFLGFRATTVMTSPMANTWMNRAEAKNMFTMTLPESIRGLIGNKNIVADNVTAMQHEFMKSLLLKAVGPSAVLAIKPLVESLILECIKDMGRYAETGEEFQLVPILEELSLKVIVATYLGEVTPGELEAIRSAFNGIWPAMLSIPRRLPWPLSLTPLAKLQPFNFGHGMKMKAEVSKVISSIVERRRQQLISSSDWESKYIVDKILEKELEQRSNGGPAEGELEVDEEFIIGNVLVALIAGQSTTTATVTRLVHFLTAPELKDASEKILEEIFANDLKQGSEKNGGLFENFPLVNSLTLESSRLFPALPGSFRQTREDLNFNGYKIPKGVPLLYSFLPSAMSEEYYPEPERVCPFRFLNDKRSAPSEASGAEGMRSAEEPGQPKPIMFGFGRHYCPGRELSKLEIVIFLKGLFSSYGVHLAEGQDLRGRFLDNVARSGVVISLSKKTLSASG